MMPPASLIKPLGGLLAIPVPNPVNHCLCFVLFFALSSLMIPVFLNAVSCKSTNHADFQPYLLFILALLSGL